MNVGQRGLTAAQPDRSQAARAEDRGLAKAAQEFESLFTQRLVEAMRKPSDEDANRTHGMLDHLMNESLAKHLSQGQGLGIASFLYRQWTGGELGRASLASGTTGLASGATGLDLPASRMSAPSPGGEMNAPTTIPDVKYDPGSVDDGSRPLRDMLPPTGLEEGPLSSAQPHSESDYSNCLEGTVQRTDSGAVAPLRAEGERSWT